MVRGAQSGGVVALRSAPHDPRHTHTARIRYAAAPCIALLPLWFAVTYIPKVGGLRI